MGSPTTKRPRTVRKHRYPGPDQDGALAMHNDPTGTSDRHSAYYAALAEAAAERCELLERHLEHLGQLRAEHLGES